MRRDEIACKAAYSAAASAALLGADASAVVVYSGVQDLAIEQAFAQNLSIDDDEYADLLLKNYVFFGGNYQGASIPFEPGKIVGFSTGLNYASALGAGELVDAAATAAAPFVVSLAYGANNPNAEFNDAEGAFIGLSFPIGGAMEENLHYGWVRVSIDNAAGTFIINDWAYEDVPGVGILTGDTGPDGLPGDYNADGAVDTADYTVWRDNLGTDFALSGNGDEQGASEGVVDQADYDLWRGQYGAGAAPGAASPAPEPHTLGLLAAGALGLTALRRRRGPLDHEC
ncbi:PEP-CTERM motif protein [Posidoniimonas corsicana]|uniref:PEP-CTERM motif protein n=1 Tax=Posidoniimonas corsicana TaxID=1938618 RepID=A0A5C5UY26_9BACT|nr:PEP-CTERM sorting domain-containing protein [Posidoniimonas corsicana]TWT31068.1 PEP-CTERM motif protein [Posidoniimonas corsicana]